MNFKTKRFKDSFLDALNRHSFYVMGGFDIDMNGVVVVIMPYNVLTSNKGLEFLNVSFLHGLLPSCLVP